MVRRGEITWPPPGGKHTHRAKLDFRSQAGFSFYSHIGTVLFFFFLNINVWWNLERSWKQIQALRWQQSWKYHVLNELGRETELGDAFLPSINKNANIPDAFYTLPRASGLLISSEPFHAAPVFLQAVCFPSCPWWLLSRDTPLGRKGADKRRSFQSHPCLQTPADFPWTFPVQLNRF